ncbi:MAG: hypothetical protein ABEH64_08185 [Salinirussus sp.]
MEFTEHTVSATFHSPLEDFERVTETVEIREDPLTGRTTRIANGAFMIPDEYDIEAAIADDDGCFFCPDMVSAATPTYPEWFGTDRGTRGEATSFPNLNPYGAYSNVVALTESHFQPMEAFSTTQLADGLALALEYVGRVQDEDSAATRASVNMNFLRPAGSSLIHPHLQTLVGEHGTTAGRRLESASREYREEHGESYWHALRDTERGTERWIGETGNVDWLAPYAPRHHRQVMGIVDTDGVPGPDDTAVEGLADGLTRILDGYAETGLNAFNFALHLNQAMPPVFSVIARSVFDEYYWSDSPYFTTLHDEAVIATAPEEYAADIRDRF